MHNPGESSPFTRVPVRFASEGIECAGWLYLPRTASDASPVPGVCMAPGLGWVKEMGLPAYAEALATRGIATLLFDYRHYGESGGEPREHLVPTRQMEDYRNALSYLGLRPEVDADRLGIWGVSFSGGHVLQVAAYDARVRAVVSVTPAVDVYAFVRGSLPPEAFAKRARKLAAERVRAYREAEHRHVPLSGEDRSQGAIMGGESFAWQTRMSEGVPSFRNRMTLDSLERMGEHSPGLHIERIAPTPLMMIVASQDQEVSVEAALEAFERAGQPKELLRLDCGHYGPYAGDDAARCIEASVAWFVERL